MFMFFVTEANKTELAIRADKLGFKVSLPTHGLETSLSLPTTKLDNAGKSICQMHRALSKDKPLSLTPRTVVEDIERNYERVIGLANDFIYIENQYIRSKKLRDWVLRRTKINKKLTVIFVLPVAPEEVTGIPPDVDPKTNPIDELTNHGLFLQHEILMSLEKELGSRFGMYSIVRRMPSAKNQLTNSCKSAQIYVHSKLLIVDDVYCSIGSANANARSFEVDTEMNIGFYDPELVRTFRRALWGE